MFMFYKSLNCSQKSFKMKINMMHITVYLNLSFTTSDLHIKAFIVVRMSESIVLL